MEVDEAFRVDREIRYHLQGRTVRRTKGGNATSFWMVKMKFRVGWVGRSLEKFPGTSGWRSLNTARSVWVYAGVVKGYAVVSEDHRTKGNAAYSASPHVVVIHPAPYSPSRRRLV